MRSRVASGKTAPGVQAGSGMPPRRTQRSAFVGAGNDAGPDAVAGVVTGERTAGAAGRIRGVRRRATANQAKTASTASATAAKSVFLIVRPPWKGRTAHGIAAEPSCQRA